jgi:hypothetical protein
MLAQTIVGVSSASEPYGSKNDKSIKDILMSLEDGAMERWRKGDPMGWIEISAPEITYIDPGLTKPIMGLEEYKKYIEQFKGKVSYKGSIYKNAKVALYDNVAILTYNYKGLGEFSNSDNEKPIWNTTEVYCRFNNSWKIIHTHWSYINHKLPENLEVPIPVELKKVNYEGVLKEIMRLEAAAMERWRRGDPWGFTDISANEVTYFDSGTPRRLDGLKALKQEYGKRVGKIHFDVMEFIGPKIQLHGNTAILFYRFFDTFLNPDGSIQRRNPWNCTEVYTKKGGKWEIVHTHWSLIKGERM